MSLVTPPNSGSRGLALATAHLSREAYKRLGELQSDWFSSKKQKTSSSSKKKQKMGRTVQQHKGSGVYKGSFNAPKKVKTTKEDLVLTKGSGGTIETFGRCQGGEIVWVGASTCNVPEIAFHVAKAMLRKLLNSAGIKVYNDQEAFINEIVFIVPFNENAAGFSLRMQFIDGNGVIVATTYNLLATDTLSSLANNSDLKDYIINYANASTDKICISLKLYQLDNAAIATTGKLVATLNLNNEMLHFHSSVKLVVQNRTRGAAGGVDIDVIDAQPLKGKMYYFKKGNPELRILKNNIVNDTFKLFSRWSDTTVKLISDQSPGYDTYNLSNPPTPKFWNNCSKSADISLEPGDLKEVTIVNETSKYFSDFVRSLAWYNGAGNRRQKIGDCVYICLEERLNSGSTNPIVVQYEAEANFTCHLTTAKVDPIQKSFSTTEINLVAP